MSRSEMFCYAAIRQASDTAKIRFDPTPIFPGRQHLPRAVGCITGGTRGPL